MNPLRDAFAGELEVALGLESTDPTVLGRFVNKGSPPSEYLAAADWLASIGVRRKAYLLLKPPYLAESEAVADVVRSVREAAPHFDSISVNPVHIQNGTVVEWLYHRGRYRPPWLWSLVDVLRDGSAVRGSSRLVSFPTAGGLPRGPHNCGVCDTRVLAAIEEASLSQEFSGLEELDCPCPVGVADDARLHTAGGRGMSSLVPRLAGPRRRYHSPVPEGPRARTGYRGRRGGTLRRHR